MRPPPVILSILLTLLCSRNRYPRRASQAIRYAEIRYAIVAYLLD